MAQVYVALGSNQGQRFKNLLQALKHIKKIPGLQVVRSSSVYESSALLPPLAPEEWNLPFLNAVLEIRYPHRPEDLLKALKDIERALGRKTPLKKWQPRPMDLDILLFEDQIIKTKNLLIPHPGLGKRAFVLSPLKELCPLRIVPGTGGKNLLQLSRSIGDKLPAWMHIVNATPDSFSDGGEMSVEKFYQDLNKLSPDVQIVDLGGESTRPTARPLKPQEEKKRLKPFLKAFFDFYKQRDFAPKISVDTRHGETALWALKEGVDIINDVSGLKDKKMWEVLKNPTSDYVLMHSLSVPVSPVCQLPPTCDVVEEIKNWLSLKIKLLKDRGVDLNRVIFDPGIGFGKSPGQSLEILCRIEEFLDFPVRVLVGHSRKSVMKNFSSPVARERDAESMGISLKLAGLGVDIVRVHKAFQHSRMFLAFQHLKKNAFVLKP